MTRLATSLAVAVLAAAIGVALYEAKRDSEAREEVRALRKELEPLNEQMERLSKERDQATDRAAALVTENRQLRDRAAEVLKLRDRLTQLQTAASEQPTSRPGPQPADDPLTRALLAFKARAAELNEKLEQRPDLQIPELQFLEAEDWLTAAKDATFDSEAATRKALSRLRSLSKMKFGKLFGHALSRYIDANNGQLPPEPAALEGYFETPVDPALLRRYEMLKTGSASSLSQDEWAISEKAPVDRDFDAHLYIRPNGSGLIRTGVNAGGDPDKSWNSR